MVLDLYLKYSMGKYVMREMDVAITNANYQHVVLYIFARYICCLHTKPPSHVAFHGLRSF